MNSLRSATIAALLLTSACGNGVKIGPDRAQAYFAENRSGLERIAAEAILCRPETGSHWRRRPIRCTSAEGNSEALVAAMNATDAQWIRVDYSEPSDDAPVAIVRIATYVYGVSYAGEIESFDYKPSPELHAEYEHRDDGLSVIERKPVTEAPHHWFWWRIRR